MDYKKYMEKAGVPLHYEAEFKACMKRAQKSWSVVFWYKLLAPIAMLFICPFLKWEDNYLTDLLKRNPFKWIHSFWPGIEKHLHRFDNNISMNSDKGVPRIPDPNGYLRDGVKQIRGHQSLEDTPEIRKRNYYAFGLHPRHNLARYVWLGWRNKASKCAQLFGEPAPRDVPPTEWKWVDGDEHIEFLKLEKTWQLSMSRNYWKFKFQRNLGFKINNYPGDLYDKVAVAWKNWAIKARD